ncbi:MAG: cell division protein ZipA C-terminal FtsZ-binding domain-containing protein [Pseudomonadota bacterium]
MDTMQIILLSIAGLIILFVIINSMVHFFRNRHVISEDDEMENQNDESFPSVQDVESEMIEEIVVENRQSAQAQAVKKAPIENNNFIMISVHAKLNAVFSGYSFLQIMGSVGLEYGEHKIFHYDVKTDIGTQRLFSVAQLNKPGTFDIDHVETINCKGLLLFMDLHACRKQTLALDCMLEAAYQLAEDLNGIMFEAYNIPWQDDTPRALAQQLEQYQKNNKSTFDDIPCE